MDADSNFSDAAPQIDDVLVRPPLALVSGVTLHLRNIRAIETRSAGGWRAALGSICGIVALLAAMIALPLFRPGGDRMDMATGGFVVFVALVFVFLAWALLRRGLDYMLLVDGRVIYASRELSKIQAVRAEIERGIALSR